MKIKFNVILIVILFYFSGCKRQLVEYGWITLEDEYIIKTRGLNWKLHETREDLFIYFEYGLIDIDQEDIVDDFEDAYEDALEALAIDDFEEQIDIFLVSDSRTMRKISGRKDKMIVLPEEKVILLELPEMKEREFTVALAQIITQDLWGETADWMVAGYSNYIATMDEDNLLYQEANEILAENTITLEELMGSFEKIDNDLSYPLAGSFVHHLIEELGFEVLKSIWLSNDLLTNSKIRELEKTWLSKIEKAGQKE